MKGRPNKSGDASGMSSRVPSHGDLAYNTSARP